MRNKSRRPSQIKLVLLIGVLLTFILILIISTVGRQKFGASHKFALELIGPVQSVLAEASSYFDYVWQDYVALWDVREENKELLARLQEYKANNNEYREAVATNVRLRKLLEFKETLPPPTLTAQIVGWDPSLWSRTVIVNRGSSEGVEKGMPVVTVEGIVGQVMGTSPNYAKILLANDSNSAIEVLVQRTRVRGILKGKGDNKYQLFYVLKNNDVVEGDQVVSSELGGVFPNGMLVGTVSKVFENRRGMFQQIEVEPSVDFTRLEDLIIIMKKSSLAD